jgi:hypothetical protein
MVLDTESSLARTDEFSLFAGGPVYQFFLRVGLVTPPLARAGLRAFVISMLAWAPLLVLTLLIGQFLSGVKTPFLYDYEVHIRLLASLPLLIGGELIIHRRMVLIMDQFQERQIILPAQQPRFEAVIASALRLRNSIPIEIALAVLVLVLGGSSWRTFTGVQMDTWYATVTNSGTIDTPAGYWYRLVSIPIYQFITLRWYFRISIWARLLWQISRLDLNLVPTHPDGSCGLGFLNGIVWAMAPFLLAHSSLLSGNLANRILHGGSKLPDHYIEIAAFGFFLSLLALGPLCVFTPCLLAAKREGLRTYGRLASEYVIDFDQKWVRSQRPHDEPLLGTGDIQSLADLLNSFSIVRSITPVPFGKSALLGLAVIVAVPILPLSLTMFSFQEIAEKLLQLVI